MKKISFSWKFVILVWLLLTVPALWFHFQAGQTLELEASARADLRDASRAYHRKDYADCEKRLESASEKLKNLPQSPLRCETALRTGQLQLKYGKLSRAVQTITETLAVYPDLPSETEAELRESLASALYYKAWDMRLKGVIRERWEPVAQQARETFRYLSENAPSGKAYHRNLEASARLCRLDLTALQGLALPDELQQAQQNNNGDDDQDGDRKPGKGKPGGKPNGKQPQNNDVRDDESPSQQGGFGAPDLNGS